MDCNENVMQKEAEDVSVFQGGAGGGNSNVYGWVDATDIGAASAAAPTPAKKSIDELAREVINGKWGNGQDRKNRLTAAGCDYAAVKKRVNQLL